MACLEHGQRPPCPLQHSEPIYREGKRPLGKDLNEVDIPNYIKVDNHIISHSITKQLKLNY